MDLEQVVLSALLLIAVVCHSTVTLDKQRNKNYSR